MTFMLVLICALAVGWYEALTSVGEGPPSLESMRIFSWVAYGLIAVRGAMARNGEALTVGASAGVQVNRYVAFAGQLKVAESERV